MKIISLHEKWQMNIAGQDEVFCSDIPATVANILYENGKIEDPYYQENEWKTYEELKKDYEFSKSFEIGEDLLNHEKVLLRLEGIDTVADIYINEKHLAFINDMHRTFDFAIKDFIVKGSNTIRIYFHSALKYAEKLHENEPYYSTSDTVNGFSLVRKSHCSYGWDWGQKLPDMGIFRSISIIGYSIAHIDDLYIQQKHSCNSVDIALNVTSTLFSNDKNLVLEIILKDPNGKTIYEKTKKIKPKLTHTFTVDNPKLWWCNGFGEQALYTVILTLVCGKEILQSMEKRIGLRELTVRQEKDIWGESFEFYINGVSIFAMGANYIPEDSLYPRCNKERTQKLIKQCITANYNCIRVWGGGYFCEDYFYDLCDEYGLIVWQDLLFACGVYRLSDEFVHNVVEETKDNIKRLRHHASIGLWCGNNELEWGWSGWDMGFGNEDSDKADYIKLFEWILPQVAKEIDPDRFYWLASPSSGGSFDDPNDQNRGDVHYWEVWHRLKHFTEYRKYHFRFCSEFGFQSFPCMKTIDSFAKEEDKNIFSRVMENHQKNGGANGSILYYLSANFKYPSKFETLIYVSQILQAEAIRYGVEHWRSNRGRCMGSLYWQLNDCWPVASWSSIDYYSRWKPLHYYAKRFYAPILLSALEEKGKVDFNISNETMADKNCEILWKLRTNEGKIVEEERQTVFIEKLAAKTFFTKDFSYILDERKYSHYLEYSLYCDDLEIMNNTLLFCRPKHFEFLEPNISYTIEEQNNRFKLTLTTTNYAKYVLIDSKNFDFVADDNCFDLSSNKSKVVIILKSDISVGTSNFNNLEILSAFDIK